MPYWNRLGTRLTKSRPCGPQKKGMLRTEREREKCGRCNIPRWVHELKEGLVPDHPFVEKM